MQPCMCMRRARVRAVCPCRLFSSPCAVATGASPNGWKGRCEGRVSRAGRLSQQERRQLSRQKQRQLSSRTSAGLMAAPLRLPSCPLPAICRRCRNTALRPRCHAPAGLDVASLGKSLDFMNIMTCELLCCRIVQRACHHLAAP